MLQGRQSISCENIVFPAFMGGPSPEKGPGNRRQLQIDTTQKRLKAIPFQMPTESSFAVNRTVVSPSNNNDDGRSTYLSFRVQLPDDLFFDCVHLGVWHAPEVELTFWAGGNCADPASIKALVAWPEVISTAGDVIRIVHPSARGEPFMTHKFYDDGSGHVCISLVL